MPVNGGVVANAYKYPARLRAGTIFAVQGTWSGGTWSPGSNLAIFHHRGSSLVDVLKLVGVNIPNRKDADAILLLEAVGDASAFQEGDILVFGEGRFTALELHRLDLELNAPRAVQVGSSRYQAVALPNDTIIVFHENDATLPNSLEQSIWDGTKRYTAVLKESLAKSDNFYVEFYLNHNPVTLKRLLDTLNPVRGFTLDAGQELLYLSPVASGNNRYAGTYRTFEPIITVEPGSVRVLIHPAQPVQVPLFVRPDEPLRVMVDVFRAAAEENAAQAAELLVSRFFSGDMFIKRLKAIADTAVRLGDLSIRTSDGGPEIKVDATSARTLATSIEIIPLRTEERTGTIVGIEISRGWLRLYCEVEDRKEEWTISFARDIQRQMYGHIPRKAYVLFETRALPNLARGRGRLLEIRNIDE